MSEPQHIESDDQEQEWETQNERTVEWNKEQSRHLMARLASKADLTQAVRILYTNHQGDVAWRRIIPREIVFEANQWHPQMQWILTALDLDRKAERSFALQGIKEWHPLSEVEKQGLMQQEQLS